MPPLTEIDTEGISAAEAFGILGNETRMEILRTLWRGGEPCSFSELRQEISPEDKGNFNYHLGKLNDHFVRKTEAGYELRYAGEQVVRAVLNGTITDDPSITPTAIDERCTYCEQPVEMAYDEETISVRCTHCGGVIGGEFPDGTFMHYEFPPAGLAGRTMGEAVDAAHVLYDAKIAPMMKGICPECTGPVTLSFDVCPDHQVDDSGLCSSCETRFEVWSEYECEHCLYSRQSVAWFAALNHPAVVAFLYEHGLGEQLPFRKLAAENATFVRGISASVVETDPYRFRVVIPIESERLVADMDENLDVLHTERERDPVEHTESVADDE